MATKNVLIIDNDTDFISRLNKYFWNAGINNVLIAPTVNDALEIIGIQTPNIVIIDFLNEDMCSLDAIKKISEINNSIRVLVSTDCYNQEYCNAVFDAGADAFFEKNNFEEDMNIILSAMPKSLEYLFDKFMLSKN